MGARAILSAAYMEGHPEAAAARLERFTPAQAAAALSAVSPEVGAEVLRYMAPGAASACLRALPDATMGDLLPGLPLQMISALLRRIPVADRDRLLGALPAASAARVSRLLRFPEHTAGALVDPLVTALPGDVSAEDAMNEVRRFPDRVDHEVFVIDRDHRLVGSVTLRALIAAAPSMRLETLAEPVSARFAALTDAATLIASPAWADTHTVAVVDDGACIGALRYEMILRLAAEQGMTKSASAGVGTLMSLSELCWRGCSTLVTEIGTALVGARQPVGGAYGRG